MINENSIILKNNNFRRINSGKYVYNYHVALIFRLSKGILHEHSMSESYTAILSIDAFGEFRHIFGIFQANIAF